MINYFFSIIQIGDTMFYKYMIVSLNGKEILYLYLNNSEEYAKDFEDTDTNNINLYRKIYNYIKNMGISFNGKEISIVVNGIVTITIDMNCYDEYRDKLVELLDSDSKPYKFVDLHNSYSVIEKLKLENYIFGVVSMEMPAIFHSEALKAQAVIARTYASKRLSRGMKISNYDDTEVFRNTSYLKKLWGNNYNNYYNKIKDSISSTRDEVLMFDGDYIDAYYHLSSNGKTEDSKNVLKLAYPYLVSVDSEWEDKKNAVSRRIVPNDYLSKLLGIPIYKDIFVQILIKSSGHRVLYVKFGNKVYDGLILARRLGLDSNDFSVNVEDDYTCFTTRGHGHGLGLSKYGAEGMAKAGYTYKQILMHYYPNTYIYKETND